MIYIALDDNGHAVGWVTSRESFVPGVNYISRWDFTSFDHAIYLAEQLTIVAGRLFIPIDNGEGHSPRYDVIKAPAVGDDVSMGFNGDYYLCGKIKSISNTYRVITTDAGRKFYRKRLTGAWKYNGTWTLVDGQRSERNPHF